MCKLGAEVFPFSKDIPTKSKSSEELLLAYTHKYYKCEGLGPIMYHRLSRRNLCYYLGNQLLGSFKLFETIKYVFIQYH